MEQARKGLSLVDFSRSLLLLNIADAKKPTEWIMAKHNFSFLDRRRNNKKKIARIDNFKMNSNGELCLLKIHRWKGIIP